MSSVAAFFSFLLIMLALATLAIILDWMGKPIRRTFRPRTTGTPGWLLTDSPVEIPAPIEPPSVGQEPALIDPPAPGQEPAPIEPPAPVVARADEPEPVQEVRGQPAEPLPVAPLASGPPTVETIHPPWQAGDSVYKPTTRGTPPSIATVRRRYWRNLSEREGSVVFGEANRTLMAIGQAPQRFNPRLGANEELSLPEPMLRYRWATKRNPVPTWGDKGLDPFAKP